MLNEQLYSQPSADSFAYFKENTDDFVAYHEGFWKNYRDSTIADLGCGEGWLATSIEAEVLSYDIGQMAPHVIQADILGSKIEIIIGFIEPRGSSESHLQKAVQGSSSKAAYPQESNLRVKARKRRMETMEEVMKRAKQIFLKRGRMRRKWRRSQTSLRLTSPTSSSRRIRTSLPSRRWTPSNSQSRQQRP